MTFKYQHLISDKCQAKFTMLPSTKPKFILLIDHVGKSGQHGVDIGLEEEDLELPDRKFQKRFPGPAIYALEARISEREKDLTHSPQ